MPLRRILLPLIVMVSPSVIKAVPVMSALATLLTQKMKIKIKCFKTHLLILFSSTDFLKALDRE